MPINIEFPKAHGSSTRHNHRCSRGNPHGTIIVQELDNAVKSLDLSQSNPERFFPEDDFVAAVQ